MTRINLIKYGFMRCEDADFSDDGNRFTCYKVGRVLISKLVSEGMLFLAGRIESGDLIYEEYSKLAHYNNLRTLNGVTLSSVTEQDLIDFYNDCAAYDKEYTEAEKNSVFPTLEEIQNKLDKIKSMRTAELAEIESKVSISDLATLSDYNCKKFFKNYMELKNQTAHRDGKDFLNTAYSKTFIRDTYSFNPSFYYKELLEVIETIGK